MHLLHQPNARADAYDRIAADYDARWSAHVRKPQARLTAQLGLRAGERCADLGCGTGVDTLEMLRQTAPGEMVAVDPSEGMLERARARAQAAGLQLSTRCQTAEDFLQTAEPASFDVITLRFCLGYLDWTSALPRLSARLRPGGRLGLLTILASSAPQARAAYRQLASELELPEVPLTALASLDQIEAALTDCGATIDSAWTHSFRLGFDSGPALAAWLQASGIAAHPLLAAAPGEVVQVLWKLFADRVEALREGAHVPLDFHLAGLVASVSRS